MNIQSIARKYFDSPLLTQKVDVVEFDRSQFYNLLKDPENAIKSFPKVFDRSFYHLIYGEFQNHPLENAHQLLKLFYKGNDVDNDIYAIIHQLIDIKLKIEQSPPNPDDIERLLYSCAYNTLHYLVWKYECYSEGQPLKKPRSFFDENLKLIGMKRSVVSVNIIIQIQQKREKPYVIQPVDTWGVAVLKHHIHALAQVVADEAEDKAFSASSIYDNETFNRLIPLIVALRWKRGYKIALDKILRIKKRNSRIGTFETTELFTGYILNDGILKAHKISDSTVRISIGNMEVLDVHCEYENVDDVLYTIENHGRLGVPESAELNAVEMIKAIEIRQRSQDNHSLSDFLFKNRHVLIPLLARKGVPNAEWLSPKRTTFDDIDESKVPSLEQGLQDLIKNRPQNVFSKFLNAPRPLLADSYDENAGFLERLAMFKDLFSGLDEETKKRLSRLRDNADDYQED